MRSRILVCDPLNEAGLAILRGAAEVDCRYSLAPEALQAIIGEYEAVVVHHHTRITGQMIEYGFNLRAIGCAGDRLDNVNVSAARALGVEVCHSPGTGSVAAAEHTLALLLSLSGMVSGGVGLAGKTLGLIGFGQAGRQVAKRALAFDMRVIVNQPRLTPELALEAGVEPFDLVELLQTADFVSLHVPMKAETETLIGAAELQQMKPTACLLNTAHTGLVDETALLSALNSQRLAGAAVPAFEPGQSDVEVAAQAFSAAEMAQLLRRHARVLTVPPAVTQSSDRAREAAVAVAHQVVDVLRRKRPSETLSLEVAPMDQVMPHEQIDEKRVARLMKGLAEDQKLVNPPLAAHWHGRYIILDGATRFTALQRLGYPYVILQVVNPDREGFALHTWYHAIASERPAAELFAQLQSLPGLVLTPTAADHAQTALTERNALCYFVGRDGATYLVEAKSGFDRLAVMNEVVRTYSQWGVVERTLLTDLPRLLGLFPKMAAVAVFPQFTPDTVFEVASRGELLPAGLTRFVIPGRILRVNADLARLKQEEPLAAKRAWFNQFLADKLARSRLRYYQEPVILLDE